jgi:hypothetical protein
MNDRTRPLPTPSAPENGARLPGRRLHRRHRSWLHEHSLSVVIGAIVIALLALYRRADPSTHLGSFYGNAAADWLGSFVTVVATKFWFERGSPESRVPSPLRGKVPMLLHEHSLTVALVATWIGWIWWYVRIDPNGKTGQVVGNIVSEWSQILSLVWFTKYLLEKGSRESRHE